MSFDEDLAARLPREALLRDRSKVDLRLMTRRDRDRVLAFARSLPRDDLMFHPADITQPATVDAWIGEIESGRRITVLGLRDGELLGEGELHHTEADWTRHLGEIRLLVASKARGLGLGRVLAQEIVQIAQMLGLELVTARMTLEQAGAQSVFRRLGFQREGVLWDAVIDLEGNTHALVVATRRL